MNNDENDLAEIKYFFEKEVFSKEDLFRLMDRSAVIFRKIKAKIDSGDPIKREEGIAQTLEIKYLLESKMESLVKKTGLPPAQLLALANNQKFLSPKEREFIEAAKAKCFQPEEPKRTKRRSPKKPRMLA